MKRLIFRLRRAIAWLAGSLLVGSALVVWALSFHGGCEERLARASIREAAAARAAADAPQKLQILHETAQVHERLVGSGFVGPEQRAGWVTALGHVQADLGLQTLAWRLAPQTSSQAAPGLRLSVMTLSASPVDTAALERLLDRLRQDAPGRFTVENCALTLNPGSASGQAVCRLNWWTWKEDESRP